MTAKLEGVVCHGHPWVAYPGAPRRCELGDFLLVHDHYPDGGLPLERNAVIVQAKIFHKNGVRAKNPVQLDLYKTWPRFTYDSWPGGIGVLAAVHAKAGLTDPLSLLIERSMRHRGSAATAVSSNLLDDGCRYGMIDAVHSRWGEPKAGMNPWRMCSAQAADVYTSQAGLTLGSYLVHLMAGTVGRRAPVTDWPASVNAACHWSLMVRELLSILPVTGAQPSGAVAFLAATPNLNVQTGHSRLKAYDKVKEEDEAGRFGVIRIETSGAIDERMETELRRPG